MCTHACVGVCVVMVGWDLHLSATLVVGTVLFCAVLALPSAACWVLCCTLSFCILPYHPCTPLSWLIMTAQRLLRRAVACLQRGDNAGAAELIQGQLSLLEVGRCRGGGRLLNFVGPVMKRVHYL